MDTWPKHWLTGSPGRTCPSCRTPTGRPILRGMPTPAVLEAIDRGVIDIVVGGCLVVPGAPTHECSACGQAFGGGGAEAEDPPPDDGD